MKEFSFLLLCVLVPMALSAQKKWAKTTFEIPDTSDVMHSNGKYIFPDQGKTFVRGFYKNNKKDGLWKFIGTNGKVRVEGQYNNGMKEGTWQFYYPEGELSCIRYYQNDKDSGTALVFNRTGDTIRKEWYEANRLKEIKDFWKNKKLQYHYWFENGEWQQRWFDENEKPYPGQELIDGSGLLKKYYPDGTVFAELNYVKKKKEGHAKFYNQKGKTYLEGNYMNDTATAIWFRYDTLGMKKDSFDMRDSAKSAFLLRFLNVSEFDRYDPVFFFVETLPEYPGGQEEMLKFMTKTLRYPAAARENGIEGKVVLEFLVDIDGSIKELKVLRDPGGYCGYEALRMIKNMPPWLPGLQNGRPVKVYFKLPITFKLGTE